MLKPGDRIRITRLMNDPDPLPVGSEGTVSRFNDFGDFAQASVKWDNGRLLMLTFPEDESVFTVVSA